MYSIYIDGFVPISIGINFFVLIGIGLILFIGFVWIRKAKWLPYSLLAIIFSINILSIPKFNKMMMSYEVPGRYLDEVIDHLLRNPQFRPAEDETIQIFSEPEIVRLEYQLPAKGIEPTRFSFTKFSNNDLQGLPKRKVMEIRYSGGDVYAIVVDSRDLEGYLQVSEFSFGNTDYRLVKLK